MAAGHEGVELLYLMDKSMLRQKIQGPVGHRRLRAKTCVSQHVEDRVGSQSTMFGQKQLQDGASDRRQAQTFLGAPVVGGRQGGADTMCMVMRMEANGWGVFFRIGW